MKAHMSKLAIAALYLTIFNMPVAKSENVGTTVIGSWKLVSVLDSADLASMDEKQAKQMLGQVIVINRDGVKLGKRTCGKPSFDTTLVEPELYLQREALMSAANLGLPNPVDVVEIACTVVFIKKPGHIVLHWGGFFFEAVRKHK